MHLLKKLKNYYLVNTQKGSLPQFNISGQATYQSDVTQLPVSLPNADMPVLSKDQYRVYGELSQSITDLFTLKDQKNYIRAASEIETQKTEVELYKLRERINNLYFGILLIDAQITQTELLKKDIQSGIDKTEVAIANGVALKATADNLRAELLKANQRTIELKAVRRGFLDMLSLFINKPLDEHAVLETPTQPLVRIHTINRPELQLYELQKQRFRVEDKLITAKNLPRLSAFLQGGLGRPGLNMLDNDLKGYYIGGLRFTWNIGRFYTFRNEKILLSNSRSLIEVQKETFLFNTNLQLRQQSAEIVRMQELMETDKSIIQFREM